MWQLSISAYSEWFPKTLSDMTPPSPPPLNPGPPPLQRFPVDCLRAKISNKYGAEVSRVAVETFRYDELGGMANYISSKTNPVINSLDIYNELVVWSADCLKKAGFRVL